MDIQIMIFIKGVDLDKVEVNIENLNAESGNNGQW